MTDTSSDEVRVVTASERPDLVELAWAKTKDTLPEYNLHGELLNPYWNRLGKERPDFQFFLLSGGGEVLARGHSLPLRWNGTIADLPAGIDGAIQRGFDDDRDPDTLCALLAAVVPDAQSRGLSAAALKAMRAIARAHGLGGVIAPVRPNWKERYPLVPIERYAGWRRPDGLLFDPWMRVHERLGATVLKPEPHSLRITGTVADWESWTQLSYPESGDYWFPRGLTTLAVDREADQGRYWEPNVWMHHSVDRQARTAAT